MLSVLRKKTVRLGASCFTVLYFYFVRLHSSSSTQDRSE